MKSLYSLTRRSPTASMARTPRSPWVAMMASAASLVSSPAAASVADHSSTAVTASS